MEPIVVRHAGPSNVRVLRRDVRRLERRALRLQDQLGREGPFRTAFLEAADILLEIQRLYQSIQEERGRRNLSFFTEGHLARLDEWCRWLVRKVAEEFFFHARLHLERELRALLPERAQELYRRIGELEGFAGEMAELPAKLMSEQLWQGELVPLLIEQMDGLAMGESRRPIPDG